MKKENIIGILSGIISPKERKRALHRLAALSEPELINLLAKAVKRQETTKLDYELPSATRLYVCLLLTIEEEGWGAVRKRTSGLTREKQIKLHSKIRAAKIKNLQKSRPSPLRNHIERYWAEIVELKQAGVGFRKITEYLVTQRKLPNFSASYLRKIWIDNDGKNWSKQ